MIINGKEISNFLKEKLKLKTQHKKYVLDIIYVGSHKTIERYIRAKQKFGQDIGVLVRVHNFSENIEQQALVNFIKEIPFDSTGIIIQLPVPLVFDKKLLLDSVPVNLDVDILSISSQNNFRAGDITRLPPVVGACALVLEYSSVSLANKNIVVLGAGSLVGEPISVWLSHLDIPFKQITKQNFSEEILKQADIIFSGIGVPHFVKPDMVKQDVIILDAGTSEENETLLGDVDPSCAEKASLFTPVPGGIGPITVSYLFKNMIQ